MVLVGDPQLLADSVTLEQLSSAFLLAPLSESLGSVGPTLTIQHRTEYDIQSCYGLSLVYAQRFMCCQAWWHTPVQYFRDWGSTIIASLRSAGTTQPDSASKNQKGRLGQRFNSAAYTPPRKHAVVSLIPVPKKRLCAARLVSSCVQVVEPLQWKGSGR